MPCAAGFFKIGSQKSLECFAIVLENPAPQNCKAGGWTILLARQELHLLSSIRSPLPLKTGLAIHLELASFLVLG